MGSRLRYRGEGWSFYLGRNSWTTRQTGVNDSKILLDKLAFFFRVII